MTLAFPLGLFGLLALPVILALHLLRERRRHYIVSDLALWSFLDSDVRGPRARRIPLTLILLLDLLIAALLSLALSQPRVALALPETGARHRVILIDVSTSMRAALPAQGVSGGTRFTQVQAEAVALVDGLGPHDALTVIAFGRQARVVASTRSAQPATPAGAVEAIRALRAGETSASDVYPESLGAVENTALVEALALGQAGLDPRLPAEFYVISDGAFPTPDLKGFTQPLNWRIIGAPVENQAVIAFNATPIGEERLQVFARVANYSDTPITRRAVLAVDGQAVEESEIALPAASTIAQVWEVSLAGRGGAQAVSVRLGGSDGMAEDDSSTYGLHPGGKVRVALVASNPSPFLEALRAIPGVEVEVIAPEDFGLVAARALAPFDLTIFRGTLPGAGTAWPQGLTLVAEPPGASQDDAPAPGGEGEAPEIRVADGLAQAIPAGAIVRVVDPSPLVAEMDFGGVRWGYAWQLSEPRLAGEAAGNKGAPIALRPLLVADGTPVLVEGDLVPGDLQRGETVILLVDLARSNLTRHPVFPIFIANMVERARRSPLPASVVAGDPLPLPAPAEGAALVVAAPGQPETVFTNPWPEAWTDTREPGLYRLRLTAADGSLAEQVVGVRAGDPRESDLRQRSWARDASNDAVGGSVGGASDARRPVDLQGWLLGAALMVLLAEAALAWRR